MSQTKIELLDHQKHQIHLFTQFQQKNNQNMKISTWMTKTKEINIGKIQLLYSIIRRQISKLQHPLKQNDPHFLYQRKKFLLFYKFYSYNNYGDQDLSSIFVYGIHNLSEMSIQMKKIWRKLQDFSKQQALDVNIKINIHFLAFKIGSLLRQIKNAAYPFELCSLDQFLLNVPQKNVGAFKKRIGEDQKKAMILSDDEMGEDYQSSLRILLELVNISIKNQRQKANNQRCVKSLQKTQKICCIHQHWSSSCHKKMNNLQEIIDFIAKQPIYRASDSASQKEDVKLSDCENFKPYFRYIRNLIKNKPKDIQTKDQLQLKCAQFLVALVKFWIQALENPSIQLFENYIAAIKLLKVYRNKQNFTNKMHQYFPQFERYIQLLKENLVLRKGQQFQKVAQDDMKFTLKLLQQINVVQTLIQGNYKFRPTPFFNTLRKIHSLGKQNKDQDEQIWKREYVRYVLDDFQYQSEANSQQIKYEIDLDAVQFILDENDHRFRGFLKQIDYTSRLISLLKNEKINKNPYTALLDQQCELQKIADYFSIKRRDSKKSYGVKSSILLFITLFKKGFFNPEIRSQAYVVDLETRIIRDYDLLKWGQTYQNKTQALQLQRMQSKIEGKKSMEEAYNISKKIQVQQISKEESQNIAKKIQIQQAQINELGLDFEQQKLNQNIQQKGSILISTIKHELLILQKAKQNLFMDQLSKNYTTNLQMAMITPVESKYKKFLTTILDLEGLFFKGKEIRAWNLLQQQIDQKKGFKDFLLGFGYSGSDREEKFKLVRLYQELIKGDTNILTDINDQKLVEKQVRQIKKRVNRYINHKTNNIAHDAIKKIYLKHCRQKRAKDYQRIYIAREDEIQEECIKGYILQQQVPRFQQFSQNHILVYYLERDNRQIFKVQIGLQHIQRYKQLKDMFKSYQFENVLGVFKVLSFKINENDKQKKAQIFIESNPCIVKPRPNIQCEFLRQLLRTTIQTCNFYSKQTNSQVQLLQIDTPNDGNMQFCINPFFGIIKAMLIPPVEKQHSTAYRNMQFFEGIIEKYRKGKKLTADFQSNYQLFLEYLFRNTKDMKQLLKLPLFMSDPEKQSFYIYFQNKLNNQYNKFFYEEKNKRDAFKKKLKEQTVKEQDQGYYYDQTEAQSKANNFNKNPICKQANDQRLKNMEQKPQFRKHSYFSQSGAMAQCQLIRLKICQNCTYQGKFHYMKGKMDWMGVPGFDKQSIKNIIPYWHKDLKGYRGCKRNAFTFAQFIKCLRGCMAHKQEYDFSLIKRITATYPEVLDYLFEQQGIMRNSLDNLLKQRTDWLIDYFNSKEQRLQNIKKYVTKQIVPQFPLYVSKAIDIFHSHNKLFLTQLKPSLKNPTYKCTRCKQIIAIVELSTDFVDFLTRIRSHLKQKQDRSNQKYLQQIHDHHYTEDNTCLITKNLNNSQIMNNYRKYYQTTIKHYYIVNWWYYLEITFPCFKRSFQQLEDILAAKYSA